MKRTTNYIKILAASAIGAKLREVSIVFFDDTSVVEVEKAWELALSLRVRFGGRMVIFRVPPDVTHREIDRLPVVGAFKGLPGRPSAQERDQ